MPILASTILGSTRTTLVDEDEVTWSGADLLQCLNEAQRLICQVKRDAYVRRGNVALAVGTNQSLPEDGLAVLDFDHNVASGRVVTMVDKDLLDEANRWWPAATREADAQHWCADPRDPKRFAVTPPNDGTGVLEGIYGAIPPEITDPGEPIGLGDNYESPLIFLVLSRAYAMNTKRFDTAKSDNYLQRAMALIGTGSQSQVAVAPRVSESQGS